MAYACREPGKKPGMDATHFPDYPSSAPVPRQLAMSKITRFFSELMRRKVVKLLGAYIMLLWLLAQGFATIFPSFDIPTWILHVFVYGGIAMIPVVGLLSWKYNLVPLQVVRDEHDVELKNPHLGWAMRRHDSTDAGFVLLKWHSGTDQLNEKRFYKALSFGRAPSNDVQLNDERVSRHHAVIWAENGAWHIRDNSTNGTFVNHVKVTQATPLPQPCELKFHPNGPTVSVFIDKPAQTRVS